jgi:cysteine desulfurase/selenocysteine lyase
MFNANDIEEIRRDFPILRSPTSTGCSLAYLDSAATALKPQPVIDAVTDILTNKTANVHRAVHFLGDAATDEYEEAREIVATFIGADANEIVFLKNATEALNLVAASFNDKGRIVSSVSEHHSNFLPWSDSDTFRLSIDKFGQIDFEELEKELVKGDVELVSLCHSSNVTGVVLDVQKVSRMAHKYGAKVLIDAAQSIAHRPIDVINLECDFLVFSGHKLGAPTGVGVLFGKAECLESMDLWLKGGSTIESIENGIVSLKNAPWKFEAGTPPIESVVGLKAAILYLMELDIENINEYQSALSRFTQDRLNTILPEAFVLGGNNYSAPFSFNISGIAPHLVARGLSDRHSICIRSGYHCAQPLHEALGASASVRLSFWIYNTEAEIDRAINAISALVKLVQR